MARGTLRKRRLPLTAVRGRRLLASVAGANTDGVDVEDVTAHEILIGWRYTFWATVHSLDRTADHDLTGEQYGSIRAHADRAPPPEPPGRAAGIGAVNRASALTPAREPGEQETVDRAYEAARSAARAERKLDRGCLSTRSWPPRPPGLRPRPRCPRRRAVAA